MDAQRLVVRFYILNMNNIDTTRLELRHITESDAQDIYEYSQEPNVGPAAGWKPHDNIEETRSVMEAIFLNQPELFGMVLKENGKLIGTVGLIPDPKRANNKALMLGYAMSERYWCKGLMTEAVTAVIDRAFKELQIDIITCCCYDENHGSARVMEKCGFMYEGYMRQAEMRYDGKVLDMRCYSITREEVEKIKFADPANK